MKISTLWCNPCGTGGLEYRCCLNELTNWLAANINKSAKARLGFAQLQVHKTLLFDLVALQYVVLSFYCLLLVYPGYSELSLSVMILFCGNICLWYLTQCRYILIVTTATNFFYRNKNNKIITTARSLERVCWICKVGSRIVVKW